MVASPESFRGWNVPSRGPSRSVRYDRLARGGYCPRRGQSEVPQITPFPSSVAILAMADKRSTANPSETPMASYAVKQQVHSLLALFTLVCVLLVCAFSAHAQSPAGH
jgi:hypothetical protein